MKNSAILALAIGAAAAVACAGAPRGAGGPAPARVAPGRAGLVASNVRRADYAGSAACARCHGAIAQSFAHAPMRTMTRDIHGATVQAPFDGTVFHFKDDTVTLETKNGERFMRLDARGTGRISYKVTRVIGGRTREDFAGVAVDGGDEHVLPVSYLLARRTLRYKGYSVMIRERSTLAEGAVWNQTCIFCHNTSPYLLTWMGALPARAAAYQGVSVDRILPPEKRWTLEITDDRAFVRALREEASALGGSVDEDEPKRAAQGAISVVRTRFRASHLIETGIGCEACHGGSREHAESPRVRPTFVPVAPFARVKETTTRAEQINHACARCHQVLFSRYPFTWEGGRREGNRLGGSNINSGEARDLLLGGCAKGLSCPACHDPHAKDDHARERAIEAPSGNGVCTTCHAKYAEKDALAAHSRHSPDGAAGACVACHMPKKNMSLTSGLTRYHRIGSPTDPMRVMLDRPLECALCHADKTVLQVTVDMERLYGKHYERETLRALYGDLDANVLVATLTRGKPHEQAVALAVLGAAKRKDAAPLVYRALTHAYPLVREYARAALGAMLGRPCDVDVSLPIDQVAEQGKKCLEVSQIPVLPAQTEHERPADEPDDGED